MIQSEMKEYYFTELGYFFESELKEIKEIMEDKTFMRFKISWSNSAGNCILIIKTDYYDKDISYEENEKDIKEFFLHCMISALAITKKHIKNDSNGK